LHVPAWLWVATLIGLLAVLAADLVLGRRGPAEVSTRAAVRGIGIYVGLALLFGVGIWVFGGSQPAGEYLAGYVLEYSLSVDNLFVYLLLMTSFAVPPALRPNVLLVGIVGTLVLRGPFIVLGAEAAQRFSATFYVFGALLIYTAYKLAWGGEEEEVEASEHVAVRLASKVMPTTSEYDGARLTTLVDGKRAATPLLLVMLAVSITGLVFALDSIPAIFGVTKDTYIIVTANAFALMGLRQLYFLIGGLLERLVHLDKGLAIILGFIGVKLVLEALHEEGVDWAPSIGVGLSLSVIVAVLAVTVVASLVAERRTPQSRPS
jgi:tellurite resistance protein TerC